MPKKKRNVRAWIYIGSHVLALLLALLWVYGDAHGLTYTMLTFLGYSLIIFAESMINTAILDASLHKWEGKHIFGPSVQPPRFLRKTFYVYLDGWFGVHLGVLVLQVIYLAYLLAALLLGGVYAWDCFSEKIRVSSDFYEQCSLAMVIVSLIVGGILAIAITTLATLVERQEKKKNPDKERRSLLQTIRQDRKLRQQMADWQWQKPLRQQLQRQCHKYQKRDYLLQADMGKIEQRILMPYEKYINYDMEADPKGKRLLTVRSKRDGEMIFQAPIKR